MTAIQAHGSGDPRVSPALSSHLERHRRTHGLLLGGRDVSTNLVPALAGARRLSTVLLDWPARSQRRALRNAMLASTALVERRIERDEVESFLRQHETARRSADQA